MLHWWFRVTHGAQLHFLGGKKMMLLGTLLQILGLCKWGDITDKSTYHLYSLGLQFSCFRASVFYHDPIQWNTEPVYTSHSQGGAGLDSMPRKCFMTTSSNATTISQLWICVKYVLFLTTIRERLDKSVWGRLTESKETFLLPCSVELMPSLGLASCQKNSWLMDHK